MVLVHQQFELQADKQPNKIAIIDGKNRLSYIELNSISNKIAHWLHKNIFYDNKIAVLVDRNQWMIIAAMSIIKSGKAFIPLDGNLPEAHVATIFNDSEVKTILTETKYLAKFSQLFPELTILSIDDYQWFENENATNLNISVNLDDPMYITYTSGSTGAPKGVICRHRSVINRFSWFMENDPLVITDKYAQKAPFTFVDSIWEIFYPLANGIEVVIIPNEILLNPQQLISFIDLHKITRIDLVPSLLKLIISVCELNEAKLLSVNLWTVSGEFLSVSLVEEFFSTLPKHKLLNRYGSTEATSIFWFDTQKWYNQKIRSSFIPIGYPIKNTQIYVLDENLLPVAKGKTGELYVSGDSLALGYVNNPQLTKQKFLNLPYYDNIKAYKTGDMVRVLEDGSLEFRGRLDQLVKINGNLIELSEVELAIKASNLINECVVVSLSHEDENYLCAYIIPYDTDSNYTKGNLKSFLQGRLPQYMIPSHFINITKLPLNRNGKVDKTQLPKPIIHLNNFNLIKTNVLSIELMLEVWQVVFKFHKINLDSNFFHLGGNSILAAKLVANVQKYFKIDLQISQIFKYPTPNLLFDYINKSMITENAISFNISPKNQTSRLATWQQEALCFIEYLKPQPHYLYNVNYTYLIHGQIKVDLLEQAIHILISRHEILRTIFILNIDKVEQIVLDGYQPSINAKYIHPDNVYSTALEDSKTRLDIKNQPWLVNVYIINATKFMLNFVFHHIIIDDESFQIFISELNDIYACLLNNTKIQLKPLELQYINYSIYQSNFENSKNFKDQLNFWNDYLKSSKPSLINYSYQKPGNLENFGNKVIREIDNNYLNQQIAELSKMLQLTPFMIYLGIFNLVLNRYAQEDDLVIGIPLSNRPSSFQNIMGFFLHTLPFRVLINNEDSVLNFFNQLKANCLNLFANNDVSLKHILEFISHNDQTNNLFNHIFVYQNYTDLAKLDIEDCQIENIDINNKSSKFPLSFFIVETATNIKIVIEYNQQLYTQELINGFIDLYSDMLYFICNNITDLQQLNIKDCPYVSTTERQLILQHSQGENYQLDSHNLFDLILAQAKKTPDKIAITDNVRQLSYQQLITEATIIANRIHYYDMEGKYNEVIGICLDRSIEMVIAILAVFKLGAAYVPISPELPQLRNKYILSEANINVLIYNELTINYVITLTNNEDLSSLILVNLSNEDPQIINYPELLLPHSELACILFTSGSTGTPKGIRLSQASLVNRIRWMHNAYKLQEIDIVLFKTPYTFDVSIGEIFATLTIGAKLVVATGNTHKNTPYLANLIDKNKISWINFVPAQLEQLIEEYNEQEFIWTNLRLIVSSGESLTTLLANKILDKLPSISLLNVYGPTETGEVTSYLVKQDQLINKPTVPIGYPMFNCKCYVLDRNLNRLPIGVAGELYISGICLATGYLNNKKLTNQFFISNPYDTYPYDKLYKTGDIVRLMHDGSLEFINRHDFQVKINGLRVELGEIEQQVLKIPAIKHAVVLHKKINDNPIIIVYYITREKFHITHEEIKTYLSQHLPHYMVPHIFIKLTELMLNQNTKIDRQYLLDLPILNSNTLVSSKAPLVDNQAEQQVLDIWHQIFAIDILTIYQSNFFEIGGNSLTATKLLRAINKHFSSNFSLDLILKYPTVKSMASEIIIKLNQTETFTKTNNNELLITLRQNPDSTTKCYLFPPAITGAETYITFAQLFPKDIPIFSFNSYNKYQLDQDTIKNNIEEIAKIYVDMIIKNNQNALVDHFILAGWSLGGLLAYSTANLLQQAYPLANINIFMIDSRLKVSGYYNEQQRYSTNIDTFINTLPSNFKEEFSINFDNQILEQLKNELIMHETYIPAILDNKIKVTLFAATNYNSNSAGHEIWLNYAPHAEIVYIEKDHYSIMEKHSLTNIIDYLINNVNL